MSAQIIMLPACSTCESYEDRLSKYSSMETWELDALEAEYEKHLETHKEIHA